MRVLLTFVGGHGHFEPVAHVARALAAAGHDVAFGCGPPMAEAVRARGFAVFPMGAAEPATGRDAAPRTALLPVDPVREERDLRERFVRRAGRSRARLATSLCDAWRPDVVVCDETDFGALVAAERLGLPYAAVVVVAAGGFVRPDVVGEALDALRAGNGLAPDPALASWRRHLVLAPLPPSYRDPADPLPATAVAYRPPVGADAPAAAPPWPRASGRRPRAYFTLGTVFNLESGDLFERVLAGLGALPVDVVATVGHALDPAVLGEPPPNVRIARWVPQAAVLPECDVVVSQGGSGVVLGALAHGVPSVLLPIGADQPRNAARCEALGVARVVDAERATPRDVGSAVEIVLGEPAFRARAGALRDEIASLPDVAEVVPRLEALAAGSMRA